MIRLYYILDNNNDIMHSIWCLIEEALGQSCNHLMYCDIDEIRVWLEERGISGLLTTSSRENVEPNPGPMFFIIWKTNVKLKA